MQHTLFIGGD